MPQDPNVPAPAGNGPPDPPDRRNIAAAALLLAVLIGLALFLLPVAAKGFQGTLTGEHGIGRFFLNVVGSRIDPLILTGITGVLAVGSAFLAGGGHSNRLFFTIVGLCALLIAILVVLLVLLSDDLVARKLYNYGSERIADADSFRSAVNWAVGGTCLWLLGVLGAQVGLRAIVK